MKENYFKQFSDQELVDMSDEFEMEFIPLDSKLRIAAHDIFNGETLNQIMGVSHLILKEMTLRFQRYIINKQK
jgi:hypothetical protein